MKVKRSVPAFVLGLLANLSCLVIGYYVILVGDLIGAIGGSSSSTSGIGEAWVIIFLGGLCILGGIIGIVGCSLCFKKAKIGGILLMISCVMTGSLLIFMLIGTLSGNGFEVNIFMYLIPFAMNIIAMICAFTAKERTLHKNVYSIPNQNEQQFGPYNQQFGPYNQNNIYGQNGHINSTSVSDEQNLSNNNSDEK